MKKTLVLILLPILLCSFLSATYLSSAQTDTAILSMTGKDWSIKVDSILQTALDSKATPYVSVQKAGTEKELFLTLNSQKDCVSGEIQFKIETQGLTVYKQLPLDKELSVDGKEGYTFVNATVAMIKDKVVVSRPENVVNSFACFDENGRKVLHIYASKLIDAKGASIWVDSSLENGLLTVYLDQKWLDMAVFPVIVDPVFGFTGVGGTQSAIYSDRIRTNNFTLTELGRLTSIVIYGDGDSDIELGIYNASLAGLPEGLVAKLAGTAHLPVSAGWVYLNCSLLLSAGEYAFGWVAVSGNTYYDSGLGINHRSATGFTGIAWDNPFVSAENTPNVKYSVYGTYEAEVTPTPTPSPSPSPSPSPTPETGVTSLTISTNTAIYIFMMLITLLSIYLILRPFSYLNVIAGIFALAFNGYTILTFTQIHWLIPFFSLIISLITIIRATNLMER